LILAICLVGGVLIMPETLRAQAASPADRESAAVQGLTEKGCIQLVFDIEMDDALRESSEATPDSELRDDVVWRTIAVLRRRLEAINTPASWIDRSGDSGVRVVFLPGVHDPHAIKDLLGSTGAFTFHLIDERVAPGDLDSGQVPPGTVVMPAAGSDAHIPARYAVRARNEMSSDDIREAAARVVGGQPIVSFRFSPDGASRFATLTADNVGRALAMVLDGAVISAPIIREPILGGAGIISGRFTEREARDLAVVLRSGSLPAPLVLREERSVDPPGDAAGPQ
jgi:preprotein translocase subunit SecD